MKVNGIEIKISRKFFGHEGETCYQGTIYENGKKIARRNIFRRASCFTRNYLLEFSSIFSKSLMFRFAIRALA